VILNREQFSSVRLGLEVAFALGKLYPGKWIWSCAGADCNRKVIESLKSGEDPRAIEQGIENNCRPSRSAGGVPALLNYKNAVNRLNGVMS